MNPTQLKSLLGDFRLKRIAVIGDVMLDIYHRGTVNRISPEAPVPVVSIDSLQHHAGGAANVAMNIKSLGAAVDIYGVIGNDANGKLLSRELAAQDVNVTGLLQDDSRSTTAKTRVIAGSQHVVRTDLESTAPLEEKLQSALLDRIREHLAEYDAVILQDYNKGVLQPVLIQKVIKACTEQNVPVTVDPKFANFFEYRGATLVKPNLKEVESVLGRSVKTDDTIREAGQELRKKLHADYLLITLGERGMELFSDDSPSERLPTHAREVTDVSGAGDTVIATVTLALAAGANLRDAASLGNIAAGIVCEEVGIVPIDYKTLEQRLG